MKLFRISLIVLVTKIVLLQSIINFLTLNENSLSHVIAGGPTTVAELGGFTTVADISLKAKDVVMAFMKKHFKTENLSET